MIDEDHYPEEDREWRDVTPIHARRRGATRIAPTDYRSWGDEVRSTGSEGDWPWPRQELYGGVWWLELLDCEDWVHLGHAPMPKTRWQWFWYHWHHGRLMGYRPIDVLSFALRSVTGRLKLIYDPPTHQRKASK